MRWDPRARYWARPSLDGENMNRWTPLDPYRPYLLVIPFGILSALAWLWFPERFDSVVYLSIGVLIGVWGIDRYFWEYRVALHEHLTQKYGPDWQKYDDEEA